MCRWLLKGTGAWTKVTEQRCCTYRGAPCPAAWFVAGKSDQWFRDCSYTRFCYCHGALVKSHLDKPTSFFGLHLPALGYTCACLQEVIWSRIKQNCLLECDSAWPLHGGCPLSNSAGWEVHVNEWWHCLLPLMSWSHQILPAHIKTLPFLT